MGGDGEQQRIAVRRDLGRGLGADEATAAAAVLDDDGLAEFGLHALGGDAGPGIGAAAGREGDDEADRPVGEGALGEGAHGQQGGQGEQGTS